MSEQQLGCQSAGAVISGPHLGEAQQADPRKLNNEPFAYFQYNEEWEMWEQVAHEHRHDHDGIVAAYRSPPAGTSSAGGRTTPITEKQATAQESRA